MFSSNQIFSGTLTAGRLLDSQQVTLLSMRTQPITPLILKVFMKDQYKTYHMSHMNLVPLNCMNDEPLRLRSTVFWLGLAFLLYQIFNVFLMKYHQFLWYYCIVLKSIFQQNHRLQWKVVLYRKNLFPLDNRQISDHFYV